MASQNVSSRCLRTMLVFLAAVSANAQSFRVQCPTSTITHPKAADNNSEPAYNGPTQFTGDLSKTYLAPNGNVNGAIKCQQISGGDGYATMADGTQTFMFSFGPLSGLADIANGLPGTEFPSVFNTIYPNTFQPGDPATTDNKNPGAFTFNGAVGLMLDLDANNGQGNGIPVSQGGTGGPTPPIDGHVDPRQIMDVAVMNGNIPAPLMAIDEDDEFFLTLTNVGMIMRPDLFEQHTVHFHGYPNASSFYDGVPDASVAINIGGSFTYYYLAPDAGTYFWHCHITPPEHLQMGMVGQIYVRPRQNRVPVGNSLYTALQAQNGMVTGATPDLRTVCNPATDILCTTVLPTVNTGVTQKLDTVGTQATNPNYNLPQKYAYNDGDGSTAYNVEYPLQIHGFDPNFHFVGMTFNPENFATMKDKYFLLNGRSYPDTVGGALGSGGTVVAGPMQTISSDGNKHFAQPLPSLINIPAGGKALLRISDLDVTEYQTLASLGIPMKVIGYNAKLLRDQEGNNLYYNTNSITLAGGESLDVILDASDTTKYQSGQVFYLYTSNLDHLSNDAENFGGLMTEVHIN
ncbi:MAG: multicopper oxidase domain-containing protein [Acidobacteriaceae bacterium]|nr:multicopper oxidase domain-containing protein [Acidobacteriaceae bacterium]